MRYQKGFTIIEIIIVISIMGIVANVATLMFHQAIRSSFLQYTLSDTQRQARLALTRMVKELHMTRSNSDITIDNLTGPSTQITFVDINDMSITYSMNDSILMREQQFTGGSSLGEQPLADSITSLEFRYFDVEGIITYTNTNIHYIKINITFSERDPLNVSGSHEVAVETIVSPNWF